MTKNRLLSAVSQPVAALSLPFLATAAVTLGWAADAGSRRLPTDLLKGRAKGVSAWGMRRHAQMAGWLRLNGKWVIAWGVGLIAVMMFLFFYDWIWRHTTHEPWTHIMRRHWWYLVIPSFTVLSIATWLVQATADDVLPPGSQFAGPLRHAVVWRTGFLVTLTMVIGVLCGHVFWGAKS